MVVLANVLQYACLPFTAVSENNNCFSGVKHRILPLAEAVDIGSLPCVHFSVFDHFPECMWDSHCWNVSKRPFGRSAKRPSCVLGRGTFN